MDFRVLADSKRCLTNFYEDGDECKGFVHFVFRNYM